MRIISFFSVLVFIFSCNTESPSGIEILYFKDPDGDSLRYTRYYTYLATADTGVVNKLSRNLEQPFEKLPAVKPCRSEGKIYIPQGGEAVKTIFFSTRCDSCCYIYQIKDGEFLYYKILPGLRDDLIKSKPLAEELSPAGGSGREAAEGGSLTR